MNSRGLIGAVIVNIATLGRCSLLVTEHEPAERGAAVPTSTAHDPQIDAADVTELHVIEKGTGHAPKKTNGNWQITEPKSYPADRMRSPACSRRYPGSNADQVVEEKASNRKRYGLSDPAQVKLDIAARMVLGGAGPDTPAGGDAYAALPFRPQGIYRRQL